MMILLGYYLLFVVVLLICFLALISIFHNKLELDKEAIKSFFKSMLFNLILSVLFLLMIGVF